MHSTVIGRGSFAVLGAFAHGPGVHEDPDEERFSTSTVCFTTHGRWRFHGRDGWVDVDRDTVVLGRAGDTYCCAHHAAVPDDRTIYLEVDDAALRALLAGHADAGLLDDSVPDQTSVDLDGRLAARLSALARGDHDSALRLDCLALELLLDLRAARPRLRGRHSAAISEARLYLDEQFAQPIDLSVLAGRAHVSPFHFHRLFREQVGIPPHRYLVDRRLERAAELLRDGMSANAAGVAVGYTTPSHFATAFRARYGVPPSKFA